MNKQEYLKSLSEFVEKEKDNKEFHLYNKNELKAFSNKHYKCDLSKNIVGYNDQYADVKRTYFIENTKKNVLPRIMMDDILTEHIDKNKLADFLLNYIEEDALSVLNHIVFLYDIDLDNQEKSIRDDVRDYIDNDNVFWICEHIPSTVDVDNQSIYINYKILVELSEEIANNKGLDVEDVMKEQLCYTMIHQARVLAAFCNELLKVGKYDYPYFGQEIYQLENSKKVDLYAKILTHSCLPTFDLLIDEDKDKAMPEIELA